MPPHTSQPLHPSRLSRARAVWSVWRRSWPFREPSLTLAGTRAKTFRQRRHVSLVRLRPAAVLMQKYSQTADQFAITSADMRGPAEGHAEILLVQCPASCLSATMSAADREIPRLPSAIPGTTRTRSSWSLPRPATLPLSRPSKRLLRAWNRSCSWYVKNAETARLTELI
jgi:hypothetical protein